MAQKINALCRRTTPVLHSIQLRIPSPFDPHHFDTDAPAFPPDPVSMDHSRLFLPFPHFPQQGIVRDASFLKGILQYLPSDYAISSAASRIKVMDADCHEFRYSPGCQKFLFAVEKFHLFFSDIAAFRIHFQRGNRILK